ncbi:hypothetical protein KG007_13045 [Alistipes sp. kh20]|uniref:hypothetical protein n=1 Tax=Alistipes TaxID=239759 RepID=UPI00189B064C|nr:MULTISPECIES: hypothetical protein [Alistipes]MBS4767123.1 hypothetical protein [Alistipes montrealensis]
MMSKDNRKKAKMCKLLSAFFTQPTNRRLLQRIVNQAGTRPCTRACLREKLSAAAPELAGGNRRRKRFFPQKRL